MIEAHYFELHTYRIELVKKAIYKNEWIYTSKQFYSKNIWQANISSSQTTRAPMRHRYRIWGS